MILFAQDWAKEPKAVLQTNTTNESFLELASVYKGMGIKNHAFPLALHNPQLLNVDPFDEKLGVIEKKLILIECVLNPWYFFREVARSPSISGTDAGPFRANRANIGLFWLFFNHITTLLFQPRQTGKSYSVDTLMMYLMNFALSNTEINMITRSETLRNKNLTRLKNIQLEYPEYLSSYRPKKDIFNTEEIKLRLRNNSYRAHLSKSSSKEADKVGRGFSSPIAYFDEACFVSYIKQVIAAALMAGNEARVQAASNNLPYGTIIASTTGNLDDRDSLYIYSLKSGGSVWDDRYIDLKDHEELKKVLSGMSRIKTRGVQRILVDITMSYRQLGFDDEWMKEQLGQNLAEGESVERDLFNEWPVGSSLPPIDREDIKRVKDSYMNPVCLDIDKEHSFVLKWFISEEQRTHNLHNGVSYIAGLDTSDASGSDDFGLIIRAHTTGEVVASGCYNNSSILALGEYFANILIENPNMILIPERKSTGSSVVDIIIRRLCAKGINPFLRIFNTIIHNYDDNVEIFDELMRGNAYDEKRFMKYKKYLGFNTSGSGEMSRDALYGTTLREMIRKTAEMTRDQVLIEEISTLIIDKTGRINHPPGGKDDMVISGMLSYWFIFQGRNLIRYRIDVSRLLRENPVYLKSKFSNQSTDLNELKFLEREYEAVVSELKTERCPVISKQLEYKLSRLVSEMNVDFGKSIALEQVIETIKQEKVRNRSMKRLMHGDYR